MLLTHSLLNKVVWDQEFFLEIHTFIEEGGKREEGKRLKGIKSSINKESKEGKKRMDQEMTMITFQV